MLQFGEKVDGYNVPVLNEREIRAAAGILFLATFISLMFILFRGNFVPIKYIITIFLVDFLIRVFISPRFSPTLILGRIIVSNQTPEYVSASPKKFAWYIGLVLSFIMFIFFIIINAYSAITGIICLICLIFLFFESAFGICLGCLFYPLFNKEEELLCPGEVCVKKEKHEIQKIKASQIILLMAFVGFIILIAYGLNDKFSEKTTSLFEKNQSEQIQK